MTLPLSLFEFQGVRDCGPNVCGFMLCRLETSTLKKLSGIAENLMLNAVAVIIMK